MPSHSSQLSTENVHFQINGKELVRGVSLSIEPGTITALAGPNGAGKSTLLRLLGGELFPTKGAVGLNGKKLADWDVTALARHRAVLPQTPSLTFPLQVEDVILMGRAPHLQGGETEEDFAIAQQAMALAEVEHLATRDYVTLSGGERQRVHLARVLAQIWPTEQAPTHRFLLLDEPTASLDLRHQHGLLQSLRDFLGHGAGGLIVLHDLNLAALYADRLALLQEGQLVHIGTPEEILQPDLLQDVFDIQAHVTRHPVHDKPQILI